MKTIRETVAQLARGETSSLALTEEALARAQDPAGEGQRVFVQVYRDAALAAAKASDLLRAQGVVPSPLAGLPISVKDLLDVKGFVTTLGTAYLRGEAPATQDSAVVARLRAAGAVIIGSTTLPEFAVSGLGLNRHFGAPRNPYDRATGRVPGGSSSGAAISVTDGMAVAAIGTDTGGSVRLPSALSGLTGFKPTQRRVPAEGLAPLSQSLDSIGPLGASVECCVLVDAVLTGSGGAAPEARPAERLIFGIPRRSFLFEDLDDHVARSIEAALRRIAAAGVRLVEIDLPALGTDQDCGVLVRDIVLTESRAAHWDRIAGRQGACDPRVLAGFLFGANISGMDYVRAQTRRRALIDGMNAALDGLDGLLAPTSPMVAPPIASFDGDDKAYHIANARVGRNALPFNLSDGCALSLPCHAPGTAPVGLAVIGGSMRDRTVLSAGLALEAILKP